MLFLFIPVFWDESRTFGMNSAPGPPPARPFFRGGSAGQCGQGGALGQPARAGQAVCSGGRGRLGEGGGIKPNAPRFSFRVSSSPSCLSCVICYCQGRGDTTTPHFEFLLLWSADRVGPGYLDDITEQVGL